MSSRPDQNYLPPGDEEGSCDTVQDVIMDELPDIVINVPVCLPSDPPAGTGEPAAAGQFRPINLAPSTPTICIEHGKITPHPVYPLKKRHLDLPLPPMMSRYSMADSKENVPLTSSQSTATESASSSSSSTHEIPVAQVNMEIASEEFALEYARAPIAILPISCGNASAAIYIDLFTSGSHGRCIKYKDRWLTPREFEDLCGSSSSKDWKKKIKYGGHDLQILIDANILKTHPVFCTCDKCVPDRSIGTPLEPLQLTTEYRREDRYSGFEQARKRQRLLPPCSDVWQTAVDLYENKLKSADQPSTSSHPNPTPMNTDTTAFQQNHALNYSYKDAASAHQTPSTSFQTAKNSYQTSRSLYQSPSASYQTPSTSHQTPPTSHQTPSTSHPTTSSYQIPNSSYPVQSAQSFSSIYENRMAKLNNNNTPSAYRRTGFDWTGETYQIVESARPASQILESQLPDREHDSVRIQLTNTQRSNSRSSENSSDRSRRTLQVDTSAEPRPSTSRGHHEWSTAPPSKKTNKISVKGHHEPHEEDAICVLCRATSFCKQRCHRDGHILHASFCLHGLKLQSLWTSPVTIKSQTPSQVTQEGQRDRPTPNPRGSMTARREFLVGPREYMPAPGEDVEIGEDFQDDMSPENVLFREDRPE